MASLPRVVGLGGAVLLGLGSIIGTGVYVSLGTVAGVSGAALPWAILLAGALALCNGLSSAQLAAAHPVSGGTYAYGYRWLGAGWGFVAGFAFLLAKSASAATAALGFAGYAMGLAGTAPEGWPRLALALGGLVALALVTSQGLRRGYRLNAAIVGLTLVALGCLVAVGALADPALRPTQAGASGALPAVAGGAQSLLHGAALMFVAFTGYGRIATLGEEVVAPERTIPRAMFVTLGVSLLLYLGVALVGLRLVGAGQLAQWTADHGAPLEALGHEAGGPWLAWLVGLGAVTAMLGVLLNLLLGLSRVVLAMARLGDLPRGLARIEDATESPNRALVLVALTIGLIALAGDVRLTWSWSAFAVLVYYAITNLAALGLGPSERLFPRWVSWLGLGGCVGLVAYIDVATIVAGTAVLGLGLGAFALRRRLTRAASASDKGPAQL